MKSAAVSEGMDNDARHESAHPHRGHALSTTDSISRGKRQETLQLSDKWRCRESNPGPTASIRVFYGRIHNHALLTT